MIQKLIVSSDGKFMIDAIYKTVYIYNLNLQKMLQKINLNQAITSFDLNQDNLALGDSQGKIHHFYEIFKNKENN